MNPETITFTSDDIKLIIVSTFEQYQHEPDEKTKQKIKEVHKKISKFVNSNGLYIFKIDDE